jgi:cytochrome P450
MDVFVPPYPARPKRPLSPVRLLLQSRRNFLSVWTENAFEHQLMSIRVLARRVWICNSPDTVRQAFIAAQASFERKSPQMRVALQPLLGDGLFISDGDTWRHRRRAVTPIVHVGRLPVFAPIFVEAALETEARWRTLDRIDALGEMARLTAEVICRALFGRTLGQARAREIVDGFSAYQRHVGQIDLVSLLGLPAWAPRLRGPLLGRAARRVKATINGILDAHLAERGRTEESMVDQLLRAVDGQGRPLSREAVRNEVATLFMAGHETTANTLAWAWYLLSQSPEVERRLHAELDAVLGDRSPSLEDLDRLAYTRAIIEETLRLYPPVPLLAREAVRDEVLRGRRVRAGSLVIVAPWLLHRHKRYWRDPDAFMPERFLPGAPAPDKFVYIPFSIGPRVCAGLSFGLTEAILCLAVLARRFALRLADGARVEPVCRLTLRPGRTLPMTVHSRAWEADQGTRERPPVI